MREKKPVPNRRKPRPIKAIDGATYAQMVMTQLSAVTDACRKVAEERKDEQDASLHCQYYLDGATECADMLLKLLPPVAMDTLIRSLAGYTNLLDQNRDVIRERSGVDEQYVSDFITGARKFSDVIMTVFTQPVKVKDKDTNKEV